MGTVFRLKDRLDLDEQMIAAICARKSTEQSGVADEQKSVGGQTG